MDRSAGPLAIGGVWVNGTFLAQPLKTALLRDACQDVTDCSSGTSRRGGLAETKRVAIIGCQSSSAQFSEQSPNLVGRFSLEADSQAA